MKRWSKETKEVVVGIFIAWNVVCFFVGFFQTMEARYPRDESKSQPGCVYSSIASFSPGHVLACELFRKRF